MEASTEIEQQNRRAAIAAAMVARVRKLRLQCFSSLIIAACVFSASAAVAEIALPPERDAASVNIAAQTASHWEEGGYEVWMLEGECLIEQGSTTITSQRAVVWLDLATDTDEEQKDLAIIYAEGEVRVQMRRPGAAHAQTQDPAQTIVDQRWFGRLITHSGVNFDVATLYSKPATDSPLVARAKEYRRNDLVGQIKQVQWLPADGGENQRIAQVPLDQSPFAIQPDISGIQVQPFADQTSPAVDPNFVRPQQQQLNLRQNPGGYYPLPGRATSLPPTTETRVRFLPRGGRAPSLKSFPSESGTEQVWIATGGVKVVVESDELQRMAEADPDLDRRVVIEADEVVAWTNSLAELRTNGQPVGQSGKRWELYLEGNIVFATGRRVIYADRMYYDTILQRGTILNAELLTPVPGYEGLVRLKSDVLQQMNQNVFQAYGAAVTTSRLGVPRYWLQSNDIQLTQTTTNVTDPTTGGFAIDPQTGLPETQDEYYLDSRRNSVYVGQVPVFFWPRLQTDLTRSSYYLNNVQFKNDGVFGTQVLTEFDMFQLLGIRKPPSGTDWTLDADYLSDRGPALGTNYSYQRNAAGAIGGNYFGELDVWGIYDNGLDNLGLDRRNLVPEKDFRGRAKLAHRHRFGQGFQFTAEAGFISDRDFLEQYYEREWDQDRDQLTRLQLKRLFNEQSFAVEASVRPNDFFMQTESLPRFDHFILGRNLFDRATYHAHSQIGYQKLNVADAPLDPANIAKFTTLPGEADVEGIKAVTRQEIDFPLNVGPVKTVPYLLGEAGYWGEDLTGSSLSRSYGQLGVRASLPIWRVNSNVNSTLLNLNGLAHKVTFDTDVFFADASEDLGRLPTYDQIDDDAQEQFRRRFTFDTFGGVVPDKFDYRNYAFRSGQQSNVSSPVSEIADDLFAVNLGVRQRWQTKRGPPGYERIVDWLTLDVETTLFPESERDNFGATLGQFDYDMRWHVGDRVSILSDGYFDLFGQGLRTASIGLLASRPGVGNFYSGFRSIEGPITSNVVTANYSYRMSEKWILNAGSTFDLGPAGNLGQRLAFTRIGESFLFRFGVNSDISRGNLGVIFGIEPRFYSRSRSTTLGGMPLPPVGAYGLE